MKKGKLIKRGKTLIVIDPKNPRIKVKQGRKK
jgi:ribosomal protein L36